MSLKFLAIETSNPSAGDTSGVAVGDVGAHGDVRTLAVAHLRPGDRHDDQLVALIDQVMGDAGLRPSDLDRAAVSVGPGGYTALRIAVSAANMIALATGARVIAVPTAQVAAYAAADAPRPMLVLLASKGDTAHVTRFDDADPRGRILGVLSREAILALRPATILADRHAPQGLADTAIAHGIRIQAPKLDPQSCLHIAAVIEPAAATMVLPIYPRQPEAVRQWIRRGT